MYRYSARYSRDTDFLDLMHPAWVVCWRSQWPHIKLQWARGYSLVGRTRSHDSLKISKRCGRGKLHFQEHTVGNKGMSSPMYWTSTVQSTQCHHLHCIGMSTLQLEDSLPACTDSLALVGLVLACAILSDWTLWLRVELGLSSPLNSFLEPKLQPEPQQSHYYC